MGVAAKLFWPEKWMLLTSIFDISYAWAIANPFNRYKNYYLEVYYKSRVVLLSGVFCLGDSTCEVSCSLRQVQEEASEISLGYFYMEYRWVFCILQQVYESMQCFCSLTMRNQENIHITGTRMTAAQCSLNWLVGGRGSSLETAAHSSAKWFMLLLLVWIQCGQTERWENTGIVLLPS